MLNHSSAKPYEETSHINRATKNKTTNINGTSRKGISRSTKGKALNINGAGKTKISNALKRRAQAVINHKSIDAQSRAIIRYALETNDPGFLNWCAVPMRAKLSSIQ